jgi:hypothetical protein
LDQPQPRRCTKMDNKCSVSFDGNLIIEMRPFLHVQRPVCTCCLAMGRPWTVPPSPTHSPADTWLSAFQQVKHFCDKFPCWPTRLLRNWIKCSRTEGQGKSAKSSCKLQADCLTRSAASFATFTRRIDHQITVQCEYLSSR